MESLPPPPSLAKPHAQLPLLPQLPQIHDLQHPVPRPHRASLNSPRTPLKPLAPPPFEFPSPIIPRPAQVPHRSVTPALNPTEPIDEDDIDYLRLVLTARVYDVCIESPLQHAPRLSNRFANKLFLKREDLQPVFSFKCRGAYNKVANLTQEERDHGIVTMSAGNHAQGCALAAQKLGIKATIVMPTFAPEIKVSAVRSFGARVVLFGDDFDQAKAEALRLRDEEGMTFVPPFDDPFVIAGQGTVGMEILKQIHQDRLDGVFVSVGGGGLIAGIAAYIKRVRPEVKIIGVNAATSTAMLQSLREHTPVLLPTCGLFSDGTAVRKVGDETLRLCEKYVDDFVTVDNDEICAAIKDIFEDTRGVVEPSGALGVAGWKKYVQGNPQIKDGVFVAILSGANVNFDRLKYIADRANLGQGNEALLGVKIPEYRGTVLELYKAIVPHAVTEITYRKESEDAKECTAFMAFQVTPSPEKPNPEIAQVMKAIRATKLCYELVDLSDNDFAKDHLRVFGGTRQAQVPHERVLRIRFAERPGGLFDLMGLVFYRFEITMLQYRNTGGDTGRLLVAFSVPPEDEPQAVWRTFLEEMGQKGYDWVDETENVAFKTFFGKT
ncbi:threonine dehydratase biosynthetic [Gonapodya prolifera JEL478]|uniref:Threonine dehydratase n=1 Tax=Gonapodya prolifera (strain JEL478) TaxID=1344416 RepID=A0A139A4I7_GONPJ|nr:threonine dehydratase biosynthetic [Gonapodya prolifera JEL478]|eukprot:KXS11273.1 threonine dehydratase biosynthetic [Gonapodya prolifera JEL478]